MLKNYSKWGGAWGGSVGEASDFGSGHDLAVRGFEPRVRLDADSSEPGACFRFCVSLSLSAPLLLTRALSLSLKNKHLKLKKNYSKYILCSVFRHDPSPHFRFLRYPTTGDSHLRDPSFAGSFLSRATGDTPLFKCPDTGDP